MGDRVLFVFRGGNHIAPAVYSHWAGDEAPELLVDAAKAGLIRRNDPSYSAARMCGFLHEQNPRSTTGLGLFSPPDNLEPATLKEYSHGDAGIILIDVGDGSDRDKAEAVVSYHAGYHARYIAQESGYEPEEGEEPRVYPTNIGLTE